MDYSIAGLPAQIKKRENSRFFSAFFYSFAPRPSASDSVFIPFIVSSISSSRGIPRVSAPCFMISRLHLAANFLSLTFYLRLPTSRSVIPVGRMRAQAMTMPVSSSTANRLFSRLVSGFTSSVQSP